jgi:hypothetical protein
MSFLVFAPEETPRTTSDPSTGSPFRGIVLAMLPSLLLWGALFWLLNEMF